MALQQRFTAVVSMGFVVGALLACKKKPEATPEASATVTAPPAPSAAPAPTPAATPEPAASAEAAPTIVEAKLGDVKRYGVDKESKLDDSGVRVTADEVKVFNEADTKTDDVATLPKGLLVFRQVKVADFTLVEFPSGIGQFSQGWVETKALADKPEKVTRAAALDEKKTAAVKVVDGGAAKPSDAGAADAGKKEAADAKDKAKEEAADAKKEKEAAEAKAKKDADKAAKKEADAKAKKEAEAKAKKDAKTPPPPPPPPTPDKKDTKK